MLGLFKVQEFVVQTKHDPNGTKVIGKNLTSDFRARWAKLADRLRPAVASGVVRGLHLGDELCWGGMPYEQLVSYVDMVANTSWGPDVEDPILYLNEGEGAVVRDVDVYGHTVGFERVPIGLTWISFDYYNPPAATVRSWYEGSLYPKMASHQRAVLVPGASSTKHRTPSPGWAVPDMVSRAWEYFAWAAEDERVVGLNPWHWTSLPFTGGFWELGVESLPDLRETWEMIGRLVVNHRLQLRHAQQLAHFPAPREKKGTMKQ